MLKLKKAFIIFLLAVLVFNQNAATALAMDVPSAPSAPSAPTAPEAPSAPSAPSAPEAPSAPSTPSYGNATPTPEPTRTPRERNQDTNDQGAQQQSQTGENQTQPTPTPQGATPTPTPTTQGTSQNAQPGDATVITGNATETGNINTLGNNNTNISNPTNGSVGVINTGNGANSNNSAYVGVIHNDTSVQNNNAQVDNSLELASNSGNNTANDNMGNATIKTGDANTTGTVITGVNTNVDGVAVSEFNVADNHTGDLVLDFGNNCITGCSNFGATAVNTNNGANSTNDTTIDTAANNTSFQNNTADVDSSLVLAANSGNNEANRNGSRDSYIETGDANVAANALTFVNNNIAGNVVLGVVNIFGDLIGNIIIPESAVNCSTCTNNATASNTNNGANSTNNTAVNNTYNDATFQTNDAVIENNLILDGNTGGNEAARNGQGDSYIQTGNTNVQANTLNIANSNIAADGVWWLAIVNQAGQWVGKIIGSPDGATMAGSTGTEFVVNDDGSITALNSGNNAGSTNNTTINNTQNNTTVQNNTAKVSNTLDLSANTGNNEVNDNIGGDNVIKTGDAQVIANLVNFVNNNVSGGGKLMVTVVNVFGSWMGDLVTPGQKKQEKTTAQNVQSAENESKVGGQNVTPTPTTPTTNGNNSTNTESHTTPSTQETTTNTAKVLGTSNTNSKNSGNSKLLAAGYESDLSKLVNGTTDERTSVTLNLAWILLAIPALALFAFKKRVSQLVKYLPHK